jgi:hypothetical protein
MEDMEDVESLKTAERIWQEVRSNLKLWGFEWENSENGVKITRCRDGKFVVMSWMELLSYGTERENLAQFFEEDEIPWFAPAGLNKGIIKKNGAPGCIIE